MGKTMKSGQTNTIGKTGLEIEHLKKHIKTVNYININIKIYDISLIS